MGLVFKHEALVTFVGRLLRDREFSEWFVASPSQALASHGLAYRDVRDLADVLANQRSQLRTAQALSPTMNFFLEIIESEVPLVTDGEIGSRLDRLEAEIRRTHDRLTAARAEAPHWWKFWAR